MLNSLMIIGPFSLIRSFYRLALVIADIVSETQSAFVAERQILDGPFILNEVLHWCKRKNKKAMFFKVDFAKSYDSVRWDFLIDVLEAFGFGPIWCNWIRGVPHSSVEAMAASIGCYIMQNKFRYLGVMVGESMSCQKAWDDVVLKLRTRLSKWKAKTLSIGGRLTLLKSVLGASPLYNISIFKVPKGVLKRFVSQDDSLWSRVIQAVHGSSIDSHSIQPASIWISILKEVQVLKANGFDFLSHSSKRIGDGNNTRFWLYTWKGDKSFRDMFPRIFSLESNHQISVAEKLDASLEDSLRRPVRGDRWVCSMSSDGVFSVKEVRIAIDDLYLPSHSESTRWVKAVPIKVNIFAWRARRDCLLTRTNLVRRGVSVESSSCPLCFAGEEDVHHIVFRCSLSRVVLQRVCRWWNLDWQDWCSFSEWSSWFSSIRLPVKVKSLLECVFYVAWWFICGLRNRTIFDATPPTRSVIFDDIVSTSFHWCHSRCKMLFS
nr:RNA-directed DNA polymerase, eukaryota [Tanacetum cinerariifolium]